MFAFHTALLLSATCPCRFTLCNEKRKITRTQHDVRRGVAWRNEMEPAEGRRATGVGDVILAPAPVVAAAATAAAAVTAVAEQSARAESSHHQQQQSGSGVRATTDPALYNADELRTNESLALSVERIWFLQTELGPRIAIIKRQLDLCERSLSLRQSQCSLSRTHARAPSFALSYLPLCT